MNYYQSILLFMFELESQQKKEILNRLLLHITICNRFFLYIFFCLKRFFDSCKTGTKICNVAKLLSNMQTVIYYVPILQKIDECQSWLLLLLGYFKILQIK